MEREELSALAKSIGKVNREAVIKPLATRIDSNDVQIKTLRSELDQLTQKSSALNRHMMALERKFGELNQRLSIFIETTSRGR